ncbi:GNAT family N-acetyltransferase [Kutzneria kofuensis]|uniref:GNAT superfamily N-acetyltransferase n=1 Tax=Kutzneria kofuensis TaxID=103725 RepID=A0A7W9KBL0_9PSEU|nr:GNAT family N-acetyltransferase [Kutzneria kofuensis]MBB5889531.1 GNAT superfamily N-acetyltransferase [Kutzneria kofuensis]
MTIRTPLFCGTALAERIERVEAHFMAKAAEAARVRRGDQVGFAREIAGGIATYAEPDSPFNKVAGLGFAGTPTADELTQVEKAFHELDAPVQVELSNLAAPAVGELLTDHGYRLAGYENVLGMALDDLPAFEPPPGIEIRPCRDDESQLVVDILVESVRTPDTEGAAAAEDFPADALANALRDMDAAGTRRYLALIDGVPVGSGALRIAEGIAYFAGTATTVQHRRRGVQTALIATRLAEAKAAGCDIATVTTGPGTKSQQNVQRRGFDLLYTRALLLKTP